MALRFLLSASLAILVAFSPVSAQDCSVPYVPSQFKARLAWQSAQNGPSALTTPVVANMNPQTDNMPEIIVAAAPAGNQGDIHFYRGDGSNANNPMVLAVPTGFDTYPVPNPVVGDVNGDGIPELLMSCTDKKIRVFNNYTENSTAPMTLWITSTGILDFADQRPLLADFDADGIPEVYAGSDIFKFDLSNPATPTLTKIIDGPANKGQAHYANYTEGSCNPTAVDLLSVADCNGDPDCGGLELAAGPVIYSIDLNLADGDGYQIKVQRDLNTMVPPAANYQDGYTAVADVNQDGVPDIVVTSRRFSNQMGMYVWNKNGLIRFFPYPTNTPNNGSLACIANLYDDTKSGYAQDLPEILTCSSGNITCFNLNIGASNPAVPYWWTLPTTDFSGWTGSSVYDFNGDGIFEIVYRDEKDFRILYGGGTPFPPGVDAERNWYKTPCWSQTSDEYPIVADVDNDGETEIVTTGRISSGFFFTSSGRLRVFESDAGPWVPCRNVWNQYNYFVVNVNDDLSIPAIQQLHHLELPAAGSGNRPLNRYLSQRPVLDDNFQPFIPLPDAGALVHAVTCHTATLSVDLNVCNTGDQTLHAGTPVAFYQSDPTTTNAPLLGPVQTLPLPVPKDSCLVFTFDVPNVPGVIFGVVNDDGSKPRPYQLAADFPVTDELECYWLNNIFQFESQNGAPPLDLGPDLGACSDTLVIFNAGAGFANYHWQDGSAGPVFQAQQPGLYWVEVTDFCAQKHLDSVRVELFDHPVLQLDTLNGDCFGNPAAVAASANGLYQPFAYYWSTGGNTPNLSGIPDGTYTVTVTNARGCTTTASTWVEAGGNLQAAASVASPVACYGQTGALQLDLLTGAPPYTFQWSDGSAAQHLTNAPAGDYAVTVTDADQCVQILQISLPQPEALQSAGVATAPACPGLADGEATFSGASQGTPPYSLLWSTAATTPHLTGLASGMYQLTLTDANGCSLVETAQVPAFAAPVAQATVTGVSCFAAHDGSISVAVSGGSPAFGYTWSNNASTAGISNLSPGAYALTLTYADGQCTQTAAYQIVEPLPLLLSATSSPAICNGSSGGAIDLAVQNGIVPLSFLWSNAAATEDLSNLESGVYQVTVTDATGCSETFLQQVAPLPAITLNANTLQPRCAGGGDGAIQIAGSGGTPPFLYNWSNGGNGAALSGITAGTYTVTVTDAAACVEVLALQLDEPAPLTSAGVVTAPSCPDLANGEAAFSGAMQGTPPYSLLWSNGATTPYPNGLASGMYQLTITDAHDCTLTEHVEVPAFVAPATNATVSDVACFGENSGSIAVTVLNGTPGFEFSWSNNADTPVIEHLAPGLYTLTLAYADGKCQQTAEYQIQEPTPLVIADTLLTPILCFSDVTGAIALSTEGGIPPYQFLWTSGQQTEDVANLPAGHYTLTLTDHNGCVKISTFEIGQPNPLSVNTVIAADTCQSSGGAIAGMAVGGTPPFQFSWSNALNGPELTGLAAGSYTLTLTDANGCSQVQPIQVPAYGELPQIISYTDTLTCAHPDGTVGVSGNQGNLHYHWLSPLGALADQAEHTVLLPGLYRVTISNAFGCEASAQMVVAEDKAYPVAEAGPADIKAPCSETEILLDATGSSQGALFSNHWSALPHGSTPAFDTLAVIVPITNGGLYRHTVVNLVNGCTAQDSILVYWDEPISAVLAVDTIRCFGDHDGAIRIGNVSGGTPPFFYSIDNQSFTNQNTFVSLQPGDYPVRVRDGYGCWWESSVNLTEPERLSVELTISDTAIVLGQYVDLSATPSPAGIEWSSIAWEPADMAFKPMSLDQHVRPGTHTLFQVRMTDKNGCVAEDRVQVAVYNHHIYIPNAIYPESIQNGRFTVFAGDGVVEVRLMRIFDRWGELLFESRGFPPNEPGSGWDGSFRGQPLNPGVFAWYIEVLFQDGRVLPFKGDVTVVR